jgi:hypothetical protein
MRNLRSNSVDTKHSKLLYEGPFASLALRLKLVSVTSAGLALVGIPLLISMHTGDVPLAGQLAVGGSAMVGAVGSTVAMSFVFSPYVTTLERVPVRLCHHAKRDDDDDLDSKQNVTEQAAQEWLLKATTRNMLAMKVETVFDPQTDITSYVGIRPFANFTAKGVPMYVHPDLIMDDELRTQLVGEQETTKHQKPVKDDDDGFI